LWLLCFRNIAAEALTPVRLRHGRARLEPLKHLQQLPFEYVEVSNLLLDSTQLLCHERMQARPHRRETLPAVKFRR
jgi:hypothetical protein